MEKPHPCVGPKQPVPSLLRVDHVNPADQAAWLLAALGHERTLDRRTEQEKLNEWAKQKLNAAAQEILNANKNGR